MCGCQIELIDENYKIFSSIRGTEILFCSPYSLSSLQLVFALCHVTPKTACPSNFVSIEMKFVITIPRSSKLDVTTTEERLISVYLTSADQQSKVRKYILKVVALFVLLQMWTLARG